MALGLIAFVLVGVLGLLNNGLSVYREAINTSIASSIGQQALSQCLLSPFQDLAAATWPRTHYFDERGLPLPDNTAGNAVYRSETTWKGQTALPIGAQHLGQVTVVVEHLPSQDFRKTFVSLIARREADTATSPPPEPEGANP